MASQPVAQRIPLTEFLAKLPAETAEGAQDAAAKMLLNERFASSQLGIERELRPFFIFGAATFVVAMIVLLFYSQPGGFLDRVQGGWMLMTAALAFLPGFIGYYAFKVRRRTQVDAENVALNQEWFIPHGVIYFPSDVPDAVQMVMLIAPAARDAARRKSRFENVKPGAIW